MDQNFKALIAQAESGDVDAMVMVANCYNGGMHVEKSDKLAYKYYKMAANKGDVEAVNNLGYLYYRQKNYKEAEKYFKQAADMGHANAMFGLGTLYFETGNNEEGKRYYERAAENGHETARKILNNEIKGY